MFNFFKKKKRKEPVKLLVEVKTENEKEVKEALAKDRDLMVEIELRRTRMGFINYSPLGTHPALQEVYGKINDSVSRFHDEKYKMQLLIALDLLCEEFNVTQSEYLKKAKESERYKKIISDMEKSLSESKQLMMGYADGMRLRLG